MKRRIAYAGSEFVVEWYFDEKEQAPPKEYFLKQPKDQQRKLLNLFRLIGDHGKIFDKTKFRSEGNGIYAFKPQPDRYLCFFFEGKKIIITNAFLKKSQKLPQTDKIQALKAYQSYENRVNKGMYYEEEN